MKIPYLLLLYAFDLTRCEFNETENQNLEIKKAYFKRFTSFCISKIGKLKRLATSKLTENKKQTCQTNNEKSSKDYTYYVENVLNKKIDSGNVQRKSIKRILKTQLQSYKDITNLKNIFDRYMSYNSYKETLKTKCFFVIALNSSFSIERILKNSLIKELIDCVCMQNVANLNLQAMCNSNKENIRNETEIVPNSSILDKTCNFLLSLINVKHENEEDKKQINFNKDFNDERLKKTLSEFSNLKGLMFIENETDITTRYKYIYLELIKKVFTIEKNTILFAFNVDQEVANTIIKNCSKNDICNQSIILSIHYAKFLGNTSNQQQRFKEVLYKYGSNKVENKIYDTPSFVKSELSYKTTSPLEIVQNRFSFSIYYKDDKTKSIDLVVEPYFLDMVQEKLLFKLYFVTKNENNDEIYCIELTDLYDGLETSNIDFYKELSFIDLIKEGFINDFFDCCTRAFNNKIEKVVSNFIECNDIEYPTKYLTHKISKNFRKKYSNKKYGRKQSIILYPELHKIWNRSDLTKKIGKAYLLEFLKKSKTNIFNHSLNKNDCFKVEIHKITKKDNKVKFYVIDNAQIYLKHNKNKDFEYKSLIDIYEDDQKTKASSCKLFTFRNDPANNELESHKFTKNQSYFIYLYECFINYDKENESKHNFLKSENKMMVQFMNLFEMSFFSFIQILGKSQDCAKKIICESLHDFIVSLNDYNNSENNIDPFSFLVHYNNLAKICLNNLDNVCKNVQDLTISADEEFCPITLKSTINCFDAYFNELIKQNIIRAGYLKIKGCVAILLAFIKQDIIITLFDTLTTNFLNKNKEILKRHIFYQDFSKKAADFFVIKYIYKLNDLKLLCTDKHHKSDEKLIFSFDTLFGESMKDLYDFIPDINSIDTNFERTKEFVIFYEFLHARFDLGIQQYRKEILKLKEY